MESFIRQIETTKPHVFAFHISGEINLDDLSSMAKIMNDAFDRLDAVNMLLIFAPYDGREFGAMFDTDAIKAQFRSLSNVEKYAVVGLPDGAEMFIETMSKVLPLEAKTFDADEQSAAWNFVGAAKVGHAETA